MAGRKPKTLTPAQSAEVETMAAFLSQEQIADYFGVARNTFAAMMERDPGIAARYKRGKAKAIGTVAKSLLMQARDGNTTAMIFYLKTQAGWRETSNVELSGPNKGPIQTIDPSRMSTEALQELLAAMTHATPDTDA